MRRILLFVVGSLILNAGWSSQLDPVVSLIDESKGYLAKKKENICADEVMRFVVIQSYDSSGLGRHIKTLVDKKVLTNKQAEELFEVYWKAGMDSGYVGCAHGVREEFASQKLPNDFEAYQKARSQRAKIWLDEMLGRPNETIGYLPNGGS